MVEEQDLHHGLSDIDHIVVASHVRQLVRDDGLELADGQAREHTGRQQDDRTQVRAANPRHATA